MAELLYHRGLRALVFNRPEDKEEREEARGEAKGRERGIQAPSPF